MNRSELREKIMIILYQIDILKNNKVNFDINSLIKEEVPIENEFVNEIVNGVEKHYDEINKIANDKLIDWKINRIDKTGAAILRIAIYELKYTSTPEIVVIDEALELSKKYCDLAVKNIINAVLDKIIKE